MRAFWRGLWKGIKVLLIGLLLIEFVSFLIITLSIVFIYGQIRETEPVRYDPYAVYINFHGERPTVNNPTDLKPGQYLTIWMFGGSTTRGISDDDSETLPSFLAKALNQEAPALKAQVTNFGVDGFNCLMESKYLEKMLIESPTPPQVLIFYDGANDCSYFSQYRTPYAHHGYRQLRGVVESYHQSLFGILKPLNAAWYTCFARELWDKMREGLIPLSPNHPALQEYVRMTVQRYDFVNKVAKCFGATFLLLWQPHWWIETGTVAPAVQNQEKQDIILGSHLALKHNLSTVNNALMPQLADKPYFHDFHNILCPRQQTVYESDGIHLNPTGDMMMAKEISRFLKQKLGTPSQAAVQR